MNRQKIIVIGAGPVGALAALYAAKRGHEVAIYELRNDLRDPSTTPLNFTKSINLALSERGINALKGAECSPLLDGVLAETIPMRGRMIHGTRVTGELYEEPQDYDVHGRTIFAVDRAGLNKQMLDELEAMPNVKFHFNHKLVGADFKAKKAWFEQRKPGAISSQDAIEREIDFDLLIGADGAHSSARYHLMKYIQMDYQQEYIDTLWCEFHIEAQKANPDDPNSAFKISPNHLHIWPGKEFMFIAIPSLNGSFTCTLFAPPSQFQALETSSAQNAIPDFFDKHFPGVTNLIHSDKLIDSFKNNSHLPLISIKCHPYHFRGSGVILGDSAHAMVPFYGQGMNAGLEDVRVLFTILDEHTSPPSTTKPDQEALRAAALQQYSQIRAPDAAAINDLALDNYKEMRDSVTNYGYRIRKWLEEQLSVYLPGLGWQTKYSRVSFGNERYSDVVRRSERQGALLMRGLVGVMVLGSPVLVGGLVVGLGWVRGRFGSR